jgi:hypothetical protein
MRSAALSILCVVFVCASANPAAATPHTYTWTGTINFIDPLLEAAGPSFAVGDPFTLVFSIDSAATTTPVGTTVLKYSPLDSISLTVNGTYTLAESPVASIANVTVENGIRDSLQAHYQSLLVPGSIMPPNVGVWRPGQIVAGIHDLTGSTLSGLTLPAALDINDWDFVREVGFFFVDSTNPGAPQGVYMTVTAVSVVVPEPGIAILLGCAALVLSVRRAR